MRNLIRFLAPIGGVSLVLVAATACSSSAALPGAGQGPLSPQIATANFGRNAGGHPLPEKAKKQEPLLYVADAESQQVLVFDQTNKSKKARYPKYEISNGIKTPSGITTDLAGNLYVANEGSNSVTIYAPGAKSPTEQITVGVNDPLDVAVDAYGDIYVANSPFYSASYINYYAAGSSYPQWTWYAPSSKNGAVFTGIALEYPAAGGLESVFAAFNTPVDSNRVGDVALCGPSSSTCADLNYDLGQTEGIAVEESPNMPSGPLDFLVADKNLPGYDNVINYDTINKVTTGGIPEYLTFNASRTRLFISNDQIVDEYAYPSMKKVAYYRAPGSGQAEMFGVAASPPGTYF
jgi:YVTN family beta-propeller protein